MALKSTTFLICLDTDDKPSIEAVKALKRKLRDKRIVISVKDREDSRGEKYDRALKEAPADVYMPTCDYSPIVTKGFDKLILDAAALFPDGIGVVYTQMANMSFPAYQAMTAKLVKKLGYIYPHYFPFWFIDHWMDDLAKMIDRISYVDVEAAPHQMQGGHKTIGLRDLEFWTTLYDVGRVERKREALSIINGADFKEPEWRKTAMRNHFPMIDYRSWGINESVRNNAKHIEQTRGGVESQPDERYQRIKAKADVLMQDWHRTLTAEFHREACRARKGNEALRNNLPAAPNPTTMSAEDLQRYLEQNAPPPNPNQDKRICLGLLAYDGRIYTRTMMCLLNSVAACAAKGWGFTVIMRDGDSMVARGRSLMASQFIENPASKTCTDLVMVDTDLAWDGEADANEFIRLCSHNVDVVGGAYPFKDESGDFPLRWPPDGLMEENGLWEVQAVTPGFCRITRKALEKIAREMPWLEFRDKPTAHGQRQWMFFDNKPRPTGVYDEGYIFCENWRTVGGRTYLDPDLNLTHIGPKAYNSGTIRGWLERKGKIIDKLHSEFPGVPPLILGKAAMGEQVDLEAEQAKAEQASAA
jgi:hypothetical protein